MHESLFLPMIFSFNPIFSFLRTNITIKRYSPLICTHSLRAFYISLCILLSNKIFRRLKGILSFPIARLLDIKDNLRRDTAFSCTNRDQISINHSHPRAFDREICRDITMIKRILITSSLL